MAVKVNWKFETFFFQNVRQQICFDCRTLKVHVNVAKQMMYEFSQRNKGRVACVYLLAGFTSDKNFLVKLSKEEVPQHLVL